MNEPVTLREPLAEFALLMELKLRKNDHKLGWWNLPVQALVDLMDIERNEFDVALKYLSKKEAMKECVDIANFAMMVHDRLSMEPDDNNGVTK